MRTSVRKINITVLLQTNSQGNGACNGLNKTCNLGASIIHVMTLSLCNCQEHRDIKRGTEAWVTLMCRSNTSLLDAHNTARSYSFDLWSRPAEGHFSQRVRNPGEHFKGKRQLKSIKQIVLCVHNFTNLEVRIYHVKFKLAFRSKAGLLLSLKTKFRKIFSYLSSMYSK